MCAYPQNFRHRMREGATLTDLRNYKLLMAILISLSDSCCCFSTTNMAGHWSPGHAGVHSLEGSEEAFLCTASGLKNPASTWPPVLISPALSFGKFNQQTFLKLGFLLFGDIFKKAFAPSISSGVHTMEGNLNIPANKMVGNSDVPAIPSPP